MQVLLILQSNALKFTQEGSVKIFVTIFENEQGKFLKISVKDTGVGIKEEDQKRIFKLFGLFEDQKQNNTKGIGLGLVIAKKITKEFNGEIKLKSKEDVGSVFTFTFMLEPEETSSEQMIVNAQQSENRLDSEILVFNWKPKVQ